MLRYQSIGIPSACLAILFAASVAHAQPVGTSWTYQGSLNNAGTPATGAYDLRFRLYDAATSGAQLGSTLCANDVVVTDGAFTVSLDFGDQYSGTRRFLEIDVRADSGAGCGVTTAFVTLVPRQELAPAPFAQHALDAGALGGQAASFYTNAANLSTGTLSEARLSSNVARLNATQTFTGALTLSNASNALTGVGSGLTLLNATNVASGTLADARLSINVPRLNAVNAFTANNTFSGSVGLGTTSPTAKLHINDGTNLPDPVSDTSVAPFKITNGTGGGILFDANQIESVGGPLHLNYRGPGGTGQDILMAVGGGDVIIGGVGSLARLHVEGGLHLQGASRDITVSVGDAIEMGHWNGTTFTDRLHIDPSGNLGIATASPGAPFDLALSSKNFQIRLDGGLVPGINIPYVGGNAGIMRFRNAIEMWPNDAGTAPSWLNMRNAAAGVTVSLDGGSGAGAFAGDVVVDSDDTNAGTIAGALKFGSGGTGEAIGSRRTAGANQFGLDFYTAGNHRVAITNGGNVGIGTNAPATRLHVNGSLHLQGSTQDISVQTGEALQVGHYDGTTFTEDLRLAADGRIGIGTTAPGAKLQVHSGELWVSNSSGGSAKIITGGNNTGAMYFFNPSNWGVVYVGPSQGSPTIGGQLTVANAAGAGQASIYVDTNGDGVIAGDIKSFREPHPTQPGTEIVYACVEGPEAAAYVRGTGHLVAGRATIDLPEHFTLIVTEASMTVQVTPLSADCRGLAVVRKSLDGIEVAELMQGRTDCDFDWEVKAVRTRFQNYQVLRPSDELGTLRPPLSTDAAVHSPEANE